MPLKTGYSLTGGEGAEEYLLPDVLEALEGEITLSNEDTTTVTIGATSANSTGYLTSVGSQKTGFTAAGSLSNGNPQFLAYIRLITGSVILETSPDAPRLSLSSTAGQEGATADGSELRIYLVGYGVRSDFLENTLVNSYTYRHEAISAGSAHTLALKEQDFSIFPWGTQQVNLGSNVTVVGGGGSGGSVTTGQIDARITPFAQVGSILAIPNSKVPGLAVLENTASTNKGISDAADTALGGRVDGKQDTLIAGDHIVIGADGTISSTGGGADSGDMNVNPDWNATSGVSAILNKPDVITVDERQELVNNTAKLATIQEGAEQNVNPSWTQTDEDEEDYIRHKPTIPADRSVAVALNTAKRSYPTTESTKLSTLKTDFDALPGWATNALDLVPQNKLPNATQGQKGIARIATTSEAAAGTSNGLAISPAGAKALAIANAGSGGDVTALTAAVALNTLKRDFPELEQAKIASNAQSIAGEVATRTSEVAVIVRDINDEVETRVAADALKQNILTAGNNITIAADGTIASTATGDDSLRTDLTAEIATRTSEIAVVVRDINNEVESRGVADIALGGRIDNKQGTLIAGTNITIAADGTIASTGSTSSSGGDVVGPTSSVAGGVAIFDGITGKVLKNTSLKVNSNGTVNLILNNTRGLKLVQLLAPSLSTGQQVQFTLGIESSLNNVFEINFNRQSVTNPELNYCTMGLYGNTVSFKSGNKLGVGGSNTGVQNEIFTVIGTSKLTGATEIVGNLTVSGTVDGIDVAALGTKVGTIPDWATTALDLVPQLKLPNSTRGQKGIVRLSTPDEDGSGVSTSVAVTPAGARTIVATFGQQASIPTKLRFIENNTTVSGLSTTAVMRTEQIATELVGYVSSTFGTPQAEIAVGGELIGYTDKIVGIYTTEGADALVQIETPTSVRLNIVEGWTEGSINYGLTERLNVASQLFVAKSVNIYTTTRTVVRGGAFVVNSNVRLKFRLRDGEFIQFGDEVLDLGDKVTVEALETLEYTNLNTIGRSTLGFSEGSPSTVGAPDTFTNGLFQTVDGDAYDECQWGMFGFKFMYRRKLTPTSWSTWIEVEEKQKKFKSNTLPLAQVTSTAVHGLGAAPRHIWGQLVCIFATTIGVVTIPAGTVFPFRGDTSLAATRTTDAVDNYFMYADATNVYVRQLTDTPKIHYEGAFVQIPLASRIRFELRVYAEL